VAFNVRSFTLKTPALVAWDFDNKDTQMDILRLLNIKLDSNSKKTNKARSTSRPQQKKPEKASKGLLDRFTDRLTLSPEAKRATELDRGSAFQDFWKQGTQSSSQLEDFDK
jgi:hypothetical protein